MKSLDANFQPTIKEFYGNNNKRNFFLGHSIEFSEEPQNEKSLGEHRKKF